MNRFFGAACMLAAGCLLAACGGDTVADKEQAVLKEAQAAYYKKDYPTALQGFRILSERGNARAQFFLAEMYLSGAGVTRDFDMALKLARAAAEQGSAVSSVAFLRSACSSPVAALRLYHISACCRS